MVRLTLLLLASATPPARAGTLTCHCCRGNDCYPDGCVNGSITPGTPILQEPSFEIGGTEGFGSKPWTTLYDACAAQYPACVAVTENGKYLGFYGDSGVTEFVYEGNAECQDTYTNFASASSQLSDECADNVFVSAGTCGLTYSAAAAYFVQLYPDEAASWVGPRPGLGLTMDSLISDACPATCATVGFGPCIGRTYQRNEGKRRQNEGDSKCKYMMPPCFGRERSAACRVVQADVTAAQAFAECFGPATGHGAKRTLMSDITAGDAVLTLDVATGEPRLDRVVVNQHKAAPALRSRLMTLEHSHGAVTLTPDHVLHLDGSFRPAREAKVGSVLCLARSEQESTVTGVSHRHGGIINPITVSGTILFADAESGSPVLSTTYPEWISEWMLTSLMPLPLSLANLFAYAFPCSVQLYYDGVLESFFSASSPSLVAFKRAVPTPVVLAAFALADALVSGGFVVFLASRNLLVLATVAAATVCLCHRLKA